MPVNLRCLHSLYSLDSIDMIVYNLGEEGQCLAYTSPSGYNFNIDMNYMSI